MPFEYLCRLRRARRARGQPGSGGLCVAPYRPPRPSFVSILYCRLRRNVLTIAGAQAEKLVAEKILNLRGLKCPLPALRARKALTALKTDDVLIAECTDPLTAIDIPNLLRETGDTMVSSAREG